MQNDKIELFNLKFALYRKDKVFLLEKIHKDESRETQWQK